MTFLLEHIGITQDSFKYLKSLKYLDLSRTNLFDFDGCEFIPLIGLRTLRLESLSLNCSSCWLPIAKEKSVQLFGQCRFNTSTQSLDTLTDKQLAHVCGKSSIDCSVDSCEPGSIVPHQKSESRPVPAKELRPGQTRTIEVILGLLFGLITLAILVILLILWLRWKQGRTLSCCRFYQATTSIAEATRRRREHRKQIIDSNPAVIESVVTHGADMNVPPHSHHNYSYFNEETSNNKRKLYNPMFADSPTGDSRHGQQAAAVSNDQTSSNNQFYSSEHLWWTKASEGVNWYIGVEHVISSVCAERGWTMSGFALFSFASRIQNICMYFKQCRNEKSDRALLWIKELFYSNE